MRSSKRVPSLGGSASMLSLWSWRLHGVSLTVFVRRSETDWYFRLFAGIPAYRGAAVRQSTC